MWHLAGPVIVWVGAAVLGLLHGNITLLGAALAIAWMNLLVPGLDLLTSGAFVDFLISPPPRRPAWALWLAIPLAYVSASLLVVNPLHAAVYLVFPVLVFGLLMLFLDWFFEGRITDWWEQPAAVAGGGDYGHGASGGCVHFGSHRHCDCGWWWLFPRGNQTIINNYGSGSVSIPASASSGGSSLSWPSGSSSSGSKGGKEECSMISFMIGIVALAVSIGASVVIITLWIRHRESFLSRPEAVKQE